MSKRRIRFSSQPRYVVKDAWHPAVSPTRPTGFDARYQPPHVTDNEIPHAFRGMAVQEGTLMGLCHWVWGGRLGLHLCRDTLLLLYSIIQEKIP
jgi:hypothetical protein